MEEKEYKYDAFISYRHCDLDKFVAENLHKILETYELPKQLKEKLNIKGRTIKRVFRDEEELPLSSNLEDPIIDALKDSKYLIVICSPRLKDSLWCKKEIETFKKLRGRKNIFCVLIEGEPSDSFPEEVLYDEEIVKLKNGKTKKEKILVEPLAADVRGINKKEVLKKIKEEKLRLIAPMYNLDYDDLRQRHKLRRQKRILITSLIVAGACILFAIYTSIMLIKISSQSKMLKNHQALSLATEAKEYMKIDSRYNAVKSAYESLTTFNGVKMPYTPEAEYELVESLGVYNAGSSYKAISEAETKGVVDYIKSSDDRKYFASYDESEEITIFDSKTLKKVTSFNSLSGLSVTDNSFTFIGNDYFSYINKDGSVIIYDIKNNKEIKEIKKEDFSYSSVRGDISSKYLTFVGDKKVYIYDLNDKKIVKTFESDEDYLKEIYYSENNKYLFISSSKTNYDLNVEDYINIHVISLDSLEEINSVNINASFISGLTNKDNNAYILLNRSIGTDFNAVLVSYNYIDGNINWTKSFDGNWGKFIIRSYPENSNNVAIVHYDTVDVIDMNSSEIVKSFNMSSEIIKIYSYIDNEIYLVFNGDGSVNFISMEYGDSIEYLGKFEFNLDKYIKVDSTEKGFLLVPLNENRIIYYEANSNENMKEEDIKLDYPSDDGIKLNDYDKVKKEYNLKNKNLVDKIFYDTDKKLLFVNYTNEDLAIYNVKDKSLLNYLSKVGKVNHYFGKDKYNRIYIGDISNSYILDSNYNKVGHIKGLAKVEKDKVIISSNSKYYSIKIYTLDDLLSEAEKYLK